MEKYDIHSDAETDKAIDTLPKKDMRDADKQDEIPPIQNVRMAESIEGMENAIADSMAAPAESPNGPAVPGDDVEKKNADENTTEAYQK